MKILVSIFVFIFMSGIIFFAPQIRKFFKKIGRLYGDKLEALMKAGTARIKKEEFLKGQIAVAGGTVFLTIATGVYFLLIPGFLLVLFLPKIYITHREKKYIKEFYSQMPEFIESLVSSLKAGAGMIKALQVVSGRLGGAVETEVGMVLKKIELGSSLPEALNELAQRMKIREADIMVAAINTSIETGSNVTEVLDGILSTIRRREEINRELSALTAQGILSGFIVGGLPFVLLGAIFLIEPDFVTPLFTTPLGVGLLVTALVMEGIGALWIKKIVKIK